MLTPNFMPNLITDFKDFHISYNNLDIDTYGDVTTAIVIGDMQHFLILNGNHRDELKQIATKGGLKACLKYFSKNIKLANKYSDKLTDLSDAKMPK